MTYKEYQRQRLRRYIEAERAILAAQEYELDGRKLTRADLSAVRAAIDDLLDQGVMPDEVELTRPPRAKRAVLYDY